MPINHMEFHISRQSRDRYQFDQSLFSITGNVIFADFHNARVFAQKMNEKRDLVNFPEEAVRAGQIHAMGLIDEILHLVVWQYRTQNNLQVMEQALEWLYEHIGRQEIDESLRRFVEDFPNRSVYSREVNIEEYLKGQTSLNIADEKTLQVPNREIILEEMLMLWLENNNPAFAPFKELFDDTELEKMTVYQDIVTELYHFFENQPPFGKDSENLIDMLHRPAKASPHSLSGQLKYIQEHWAYLLGRNLYRLLSNLDLIKEEEKSVLTGPGLSIPYDFVDLELEKEQFTPDSDWMPALVLIAKNTYVWLDQLANLYVRDISRLDQIPDEELDRLANGGINGLWLIGIWERSQASKRIKQMRGKADAEASAYSIYDYQIAADLGGEAACQNLRERAWQRGIRLASDMVPNHMAIDSKWVMEQPHRFISLDYSPFPSYTFDGPNLSRDERIGIYLEDHYYDSSDAAVVFKRVDHHTGDSRYIYHGNDGTSMPWNDTAQLNYLLEEVREQIIQAIINVAHQFPIIRFDAAMTLAKKHFQRLWFPQPGTGGGIPTRVDHGMTKEEFDAVMPKEFWREVVDSIAKEAPDTLLLAEAFWLMEGYFVRTLGMHRVYNSAFMNMLRDEKNQDYRLVIKNTLEFDPEILKRYVNFMSNPDEDTAIEQFGKGDKYFGICILMATMPGLPMFGHGQIEGFAEKYGMEFRRAYWDETPDKNLIERHEREIFPLIRRRYLFAEVNEFLLYDFFMSDGIVNEDVFAYSNRFEDEQTLVVYHNRYMQARGWIRSSVSFKVKTGDTGGHMMVQKSLGEGLGLVNKPDHFCVFRDLINGMEYIRCNTDLHQQGLYIELDAFKYHVFMDFRVVADDESQKYAELTEVLNGRGVPRIDEALKELSLRPLHEPLSSLISSDMIERMLSASIRNMTEPVHMSLFEGIEQDYFHLLEEVQTEVHSQLTNEDLTMISREVLRMVEAVYKLPNLKSHYPISGSSRYDSAVEMLKLHLNQNPVNWIVLFSWIYLHPMGKLTAESQMYERSRSWIDEFQFGRILTKSMINFGVDDNTSEQFVSIVKFLTTQSNWPFRFDIINQVDPDNRRITSSQLLETWLRDRDVQRFLQINRYQGVLWFNKESFENLLVWILSVGTLLVISDPKFSVEEIPSWILSQYEIIELLRTASEESDYRVDRLMEALS